MSTKLELITDSLRMAARKDSAALPVPNAEVAFVGRAIDERGRAGIAYAKTNAITSEVFEYDVATQMLSINDKQFSPDLIQTELKARGAKRFLLECTTLGTAEIALICRALAGLEDVVLTFLYVEPQSYRPISEEGVIHRRDFELTTGFHGFNAVPGMCYEMDDEIEQTTVLLLGFEGDRAQRAFEELKISPRHISVVFGVPAFQPGWENDAFANNLSSLVGRELYGGGIYFCGADNPKGVLQYLHRIKASYSADDALFLAPLGPKPQALGAVLFAAFSERVGLLYDFPIRRNSRSNAIAKWHLFEVKW